MNVLRRKWQGLPRGVVVCITALVIYVPLLFIVVQSFLSAPFFSRSKSWSLEAFAFIFTDPDFYLALRSGFILAFGLVIIAIPLGGILAFLMVRTDLPGRRFIEPLILVPIFVSPMVLGFGYVVAAGPVGFFSQWAQQLIGFVPWNIYSMFSIVVIAGLTHVPHAYLYISSALRSVGRGRGGAHRRRHAAAGDDLGESADGAAIHSLRLRVALFPRSGSLRSDAGAGRPRGQHGAGDLSL